MRFVIQLLVTVSITVTINCCKTKIVENEFVITQVIKNNTNLSLVVTVYSALPQKQIVIPANGSHTDRFSFDGIGEFQPVNSFFATDSVEILFDNRLKTTYIHRGYLASSNCASRSMYCAVNYEAVDLNQSYKQYTYVINQDDLAQAR